MPTGALSVAGDFTTSGTASVSAGNAITTVGNFTIENSSSFTTGSFNHSIGGNLENLGSFTVSSGSTITLNGTSTQLVIDSSTINFENLTINNSQGVNLLTDVNVNNTLALTAGNLGVGSALLGINGTDQQIIW